MFIVLQVQMSCKNEKHSQIKSKNTLHEDVKLDKKDVVERFLSILWKKEVDFNFSTK